METEICCLRKIGPYTEKVAKKDHIIALQEKEELNIGRAEDATVCIPDRMISRKHALLQKEDSMWSITDNKSLNGIFVNEKKLKPMMPHILSDGDIVQLGVAPDANTSPLFVFEYRTHLKVRVRSVPKNTKSNNRKRKQSSCSLNTEETPPEKRSSASHKLKCNQDNAFSPSVLLKQKLKEQEEIAQAKVREAEERLGKMQEELKEKNSLQEQLAQELREKEEQMKRELVEQQEKLEKQRQEFEERMKAALEEEVRQKEEALKNQMKDQLDKLQVEKKKVEESLQQEMKRQLEEKNKHLEKELLQQKENLEKIIESKEANQKLLESQLSDTKIENEKQKESMLRAREEVLANFEDVLETELQCSICNELFVKATSLNCSHSFCELCINTWMKRKKECPNCRSKITSSTRSIVLDSYIDTMVEKLSEDIKNRRKELVAARTGGGSKAQKKGETSAAGSTDAPIVITDGIPVVDNEVIIVGDDYGDITLSDDDDDEVDLDSNESPINSDDDEDNDSFDEEDSDYDHDAYYGGYGRCFRCGRRGHWANACYR